MLNALTIEKERKPLVVSRCLAKIRNRLFEKKNQTKQRYQYCQTFYPSVQIRIDASNIHLIKSVKIFYRSQSGVYCLRLYTPAQRDRLPCSTCSAAVKPGSVYQHTVSLLWEVSRQHQSFVLGRQRICFAYKRLESGCFQCTGKENEDEALTPHQYRWLMWGELTVDHLKAYKPISGLQIV